MGVDDKPIMGVIQPDPVPHDRVTLPWTPDELLKLKAARIVDPEPPPTPNNHEALWPQVIADMAGRGAVDVNELVIADMQSRDESGRIKYKTPLQPFNGRDMLVDAYQEMLDASVYLKGALVEKYDGFIWACYEDTLNLCLHLRGLIRYRKGA